MYGPIERVKIIRAKTGKNKGKSRGFAFILYEREKDMKGRLPFSIGQIDVGS